METVIKFQDIEKLVAGKFPLGPINLEIERGYVVAVVGPNGSGKSTMFRMLMNMLQPDRGTLSILKQHYPQDGVSMKRQIGYVPEFSDFGGVAKTIGQLIDFVSYWYPSWDQKRCRELLDKFELAPAMKLSGLSKGMQRKLSLTLAIAPNPELLLLDEPSSGLDPFAWRLMIDELTQFMRNGDRTIVIATHIMDEVRRLADYIAFMYKGKLIGFHEKDALLDTWKMIWLDKMPDNPGRLPGVTESQDQPARLITCETDQTEAALKKLGVSVIRTQSLELDEIFVQLQRMQTIGTKSS
ncbi:ABC transporter ATP-binding protein [Paenibacillus contaminans]|uniref:ABC transporter ATP-binding protein n=1 Tax=Paenibacillus contaminans TaxID=450362 RepID=A0A329LR70_9BACL|nr:ABC transporter ATP-binding protein [Paenibacillus contaminans]RAV10465.1 ABC transporter ATP-binding protein [Paenibacillus contaminans]